MRGKYWISGEQLDGMDLTISVTMRVKDWREFKEKIGTDNWPNWEVVGVIQDALFEFSQATNKIIPERDEES